MKKIIYIIVVTLMIFLALCITYIIINNIEQKKELAEIYQNVDKYLESNYLNQENLGKEDYYQVKLNNKKRIIKEQGSDYQEIYTMNEDDGNFIGKYNNKFYFERNNYEDSKAYKKKEIYYIEQNGDIERNVIIKDLNQKLSNITNSGLSLCLDSYDNCEEWLFDNGFIFGDKIYFIARNNKVSNSYSTTTNCALYSIDLNNYNINKEKTFEENLYPNAYFKNDEKIFYTTGDKLQLGLYNIKTGKSDTFNLGSSDQKFKYISYNNGYIVYVKTAYVNEKDVNILNIFNTITKQETTIQKSYNLSERNLSMLPVYGAFDKKYLYYLNQENKVIYRYNVFTKEKEKYYVIPDGEYIPEMNIYINDEVIYFYQGDEGMIQKGISSWYLNSFNSSILKVVSNNKIYKASEWQLKPKIKMLDNTIFYLNAPLKSEQSYITYFG